MVSEGEEEAFAREKLQTSSQQGGRDWTALVIPSEALGVQHVLQRLLFKRDVVQLRGQG